MTLKDAVIVFDLDGTLVDSAPDLIAGLNRMLAEQGLPQAPLSAAPRLIGGGLGPLLERGFAWAGAPFAEGAPDDLVERFVAVYRAHIADESRPYPGVGAALDQLQAEGARFVVCTNKRTDLAELLLDKVGLVGRFVAVAGPDRVGAKKPDPRHLLGALALADGRPDHALMVGDTRHDVGAAKAAGVPVILVSFGYADVPPPELGADALIDRFADLPAVAGALLARDV